MKIKKSLSPPLKFYPEAYLDDYYEQVKRSDFDIIYLGDIFCENLFTARLEYFFKIRDLLEKSGKEVYFSTPLLISKEEVFLGIERIINEGIKIETGEMGAAKICLDKGVEFGLGTYANIYNIDSLNFFAKNKISKVTIPLDFKGEFPKSSKIAIEMFYQGDFIIGLMSKCYFSDKCDKSCLGKELNIKDLRGVERYKLNSRLVSGYFYNKNILNIIKILRYSNL